MFCFKSTKYLNTNVLNIILYQCYNTEYHRFTNQCKIVNQKSEYFTRDNHSYVIWFVTIFSILHLHCQVQVIVEQINRWQYSLIMWCSVEFLHSKVLFSDEKNSCLAFSLKLSIYHMILEWLICCMFVLINRRSIIDYSCPSNYSVINMI